MSVNCVLGWLEVRKDFSERVMLNGDLPRTAVLCDAVVDSSAQLTMYDVLYD